MGKTRIVLQETITLEKPQRQSVQDAVELVRAKSGVAFVNIFSNSIAGSSPSVELSLLTATAKDLGDISANQKFWPAAGTALQVATSTPVGTKQIELGASGYRLADLLIWELSKVSGSWDSGSITLQIVLELYDT